MKLTRNQLSIIIKQAKGGDRFATPSETTVSEHVANELGIEVNSTLREIIHKELIYHKRQGKNMAILLLLLIHSVFLLMIKLIPLLLKFENH